VGALVGAGAPRFVGTPGSSSSFLIVGFFGAGFLRTDNAFNISACLLACSLSSSSL
jgi:hypothetical protein